MLRRRIAVVVTAAVIPFTLTACFNGVNAQTTAQTEGGNVMSANVENVQARGLIWVRSATDANVLSLSGTVSTSVGTPADELVSVIVEPGPVQATITGGPITAPAGGATQFGFNSDIYVTLQDAGVGQSDFVNTTLVFRNAGTVTVPVLVVPQTGPYAKVTPPASLVSTASASPAVSPSPTESAAASPTAAAEASPQP